MVCPLASITFDIDVLCFRTASFVPTAIILSFAIATACAAGLASSSVTKLPLYIIKVAGCCWAFKPYINAIANATIR
ncbi:MAG: hypothetical protein JWP81_1015 [Ferruginibacter sp.]|nr:hypothetical protein [Ferruginibacter sp.]